MLRGVVFDMDGVVIDSHPAHRAAWKSFLESVGRTASDKELDFILDGRKREEILEYFLGKLDSDQIAEYGHRKDELLRSHGNRLEPMTGVVEFMNLLCASGVRMAIATSAGRHRACGTLEELGLSRYFEIIVTGDEVAAGKPDPAIYRLAAARMQEAPDHLLAVEDAVSGVKAATGASMRCVGVAHNGRADLLRQAGASPIIEDFRTLSLTQLQACFL
jgi:beta-phosphoglucomutase